MSIHDHSSPAINADTIIEARWIATVTASAPILENHVLENHAVVIQQGLIAEILPIADVRKKYTASTLICLEDHLLIPGLINLHSHAAMSMMRGMADDLPLMTWLNQHIWPAEKAVLSPQYVKDATVLACAEMLSGGVTCFNDMYFYPESSAVAASHAGMRANLGLVVMEFPTAYATDPDDYLQKGFDAHDSWRSNPLITSSIAPHAPYTVSNQTFEKIITYAEQLSLGIHTHLHETRDEINQSEAQFGIRPLQRMANLGLLGPNLVAAHCVHLLDSEIELLSEHGSHIAHCPTSNLKLGSGIAPIKKLLANGVNIGLGTDSVASNNRLDMFSEMRLCALLAKGSSEDATVVPAHQALEMATINAAKALGMEESVGSIAVGKLADLTAVKLSDFQSLPYYDPVAHLVYSASRDQVTHTWVAGELQYSHGTFANIASSELKDIIHLWQAKLRPYKN
jgi:5-methylthioadenosine/S-adenosylhomocysteine deaminase